MMRRQSQILADLIALAAHVVTRPRTNEIDKLPQLAAEIRYADNQPAENIRTTSAAVAMVIALEGARYFAAREALWLAAVGVLLPIVREDLYQAIQNERESRTS